MHQTSDKSSAKKMLIIHIGDHKTGSTSIQLAFAQRQVKLQGAHVFYPSKLNNNNLRDQCLAYGNAETPHARKEAARPLEQLAERVRASNAEFTVISGESLERVSAVLMREIIDTFFADAADEIRVVSYVRPHAGRITSTFAERTKIGAQHALKSTLAEFSERQKEQNACIYLPRFSAWREQFGDGFILRPMVREQLYRGDVVHDFVHHAFGGVPFEVLDSEQANESLCQEDLMRLRVLHSHLKAPRVLRPMVGREAQRLIGHMPPPLTRTKLKLHRSLAKDIRDNYLQDARSMDRSFFDGAPLMESELQSAVDKAIDSPQSTDPVDYLSASELRSLEIMSKMVSGLLEQKDVKWAGFFYDKRVKDVRKIRKALKTDE